MKLLVQTSGGLDSAAALVLARQQGEVFPVYYDWGQRYARMELTAASRLTQQFNLRLRVVQIPLRVDKQAPVAEYIPYRNLVLNAHSLNWAAAMRMDAVVTGSKHTDMFKDGRHDFIVQLNALVKSITEPDLVWPEILTPLEHSTKADVLRCLIGAGVDPDKLWTCYGAGPEPCGSCHHCRAYASARAELATS